MAKVRIVNNNLDQNLNGDNFNNTASQTIFQFGGFKLTTNFDGRKYIDYSKQLSSFVRPVTLSSINLTSTESDKILDNTKNVTLNLDRTNLNSFIKFGSAYEFLRVSIENIIVNFPGSLYVDSQVERGGNTTYYDFTYNELTNTSKFKIPSQYTRNNFNLIFNFGNDTVLNDNNIKNINLSYEQYLIWTSKNINDNSHNIIGFTGDSSSRSYLIVECSGNPFDFNSGDTSGSVNYHIKPNTRVFEDFRLNLSGYEKYIIGNRFNDEGFQFRLKDPTLLENGKIEYFDRNIVWPTSDGYNIDIDEISYDRFLDIVLTIGGKYDQVKTDLIARFLTPTSIQTYDLTEDGKMNKLLRLYGSEFDQIKQLIDSLVNVYKVTYDKKNNLPDQIVSNFAKTLGWDYFQLVNEEELVSNILGDLDGEKRMDDDLLPSEVDIELWRRILINTNYFWKSKGTRDAIKSMFLLIGIPEPFINITEYVYTVDGRIDPNEVQLTLSDLPSSSLPYDNDGYPVAPVETPDFYFQMSGDSDNGQAYMNIFRDVGFNLSRQIDNKKSWVQTGETYKRHHSSPTYYQKDSKLVLNTKEIDVALDISRGIEYDVYKYIKEIDFPANSTGFTLPFVFVNLSINKSSYTSDGNTFTLPVEPEGDVEIRYNGILLKGPNEWDGSEIISGNTDVDYYFITSRTFKLGRNSEDIYASNNANKKDIIQATCVYKEGSALSGVTVSYIVTTVSTSQLSTIIPLPETPSGDIQLTINGIAVTKGTSQFTADYIVDGNNIVIQNQDLVTFFQTSPVVQVSYINVSGSTNIYARSEITRVDSFQSGKIYFNNQANKVVYRLNYKINDVKNVKVLVDGIALEPNVDYRINSNNSYELFLSPDIKFGSVISVYYLVGNDLIFDPIVENNFGIGNISDLSFLEFIELVEKKLVNSTNRKVITNYKGGWYPTLLNIYVKYLKRSELTDDNRLKSNGYTFSNLYPFLSKYNAFFKKFVNQLLPSTIILRKGGLLIRNTIFTKQKFTYKRGVSFDQDLKHLGDDGTLFLKRPVSNTIEWTDDSIRIDDLCNEFVVENIEIIYPTTTTTTTLAPLNTVLLINNVDGYPQITTNTFNKTSTGRFILDFNPAILPDYSINMDLEFISQFFADEADSYIISEVTIRRNGDTIYSYDKNITTDYPDSDILFSETENITINPGDYVEIILLNRVDNSSNNGSSNIESSTKFTPKNITVSPNGTILTKIPEFVTNGVMI